VTDCVEEDKLVAALAEFGLTKNEARAYISLASHEVTEATVLAEALGINRPAIYPLLKSLSDRGLVEVIPEGVNKFRALPPEHFLDSVTGELENRLDSLGKKRELLDKHLAEIDRNFRVGNLKFMSQRAAIHRLSRQIIKDASKEIFVLTTHMGLYRAEKVFLELYKKKREEGVRIRHLVKIEGDEDAVIPVLKKVMEIRSTEVTPLMTFMIVDNHQAILFQPNPNDAINERTRDFGLWSDDAGLIQTFTSIFDEMWENSKPV